MTETMIAIYKIKNLYRSTMIIEIMRTLKISYTLCIALRLFIIACTYSTDIEQFTNSVLSTIIIYSIILAIINLTTYACKCYIIHNLILFSKLISILIDTKYKRYIFSIEEKFYKEEHDYIYNLYYDTINNIINIFENYETNSERKYLVRNILYADDWIKFI